MKRWPTLFSILLASSAASASELEFAISDEAFETSYESFYSGNFSTEASWRHTDIDNIRTDELALGLYANGKNSNIDTHLGGKVFWLDAEETDMHGVALGGNADIYILPDTIPKLSLNIEALYAPDILTGGDFDNYLELGTRLSFKLLPNATIFIGYRYVEVGLEDSDIEFDVAKGGFAGFNFNI